MIVAQHVSKLFGRILAVDSLDLNIPRGEVVGFLGPNGAGKTTTIRMISGYLPPTSGRVLVDDLDVAQQWRQVRRRIGYLPEAAPLYTEMRVQEFLSFRAKLFGIARRNRSGAIDLALQRCWLQDVRRRPINQLSKGYRQRVGLAAALLHEPAVLILDEPTVGLDPTQIREIRSLIRELAGQHTILLSTHILPEVEVTCDRIVMIARGRIRAQGSIDKLQASAAKSCRYIAETDIDVKAEVSGLDGVTGVECSMVDDRWRRHIISVSADAPDLRELIGALLAARGATIRELRREAPSLEQLFVQMAADAELDFARRNESPREVAA